MLYLNIIEYLFYSADKQYQKWGEKDISTVYAICYIALLQELNCFTLAILLLIFKVITALQISKLFFVILFSLFIILDYIYVYKIKGKMVVLLKFQSTSNIKKNRNAAILYAALSFATFIITMIYYLAS